MPVVFFVKALVLCVCVFFILKGEFFCWFLFWESSTISPQKNKRLGQWLLYFLVAFQMREKSFVQHPPPAVASFRNFDPNPG